MFERLNPDERLRVLKENQDYMDLPSSDNKETAHPFVAVLFGKNGRDEIESIYFSVIGRRPHTSAIYVMDDDYYDEDKTLVMKYNPNFSFWIWYKNPSDHTRNGKEYLPLFIEEIIRDREVVVYDQENEIHYLRNLLVDKIGMEYGGKLIELREYSKTAIPELPDWQLETLMGECNLQIATYENNLLGKLMAIRDVWIAITNRQYNAE